MADQHVLRGLAVGRRRQFDRRGEVEKKLREYFAIGVAAVLIVDPDKRTVSVYTSAAEFRELTVDDMLTVPEALRGFSTPIADLMDQ